MNTEYSLLKFIFQLSLLISLVISIYVLKTAITYNKKNHHGIVADSWQIPALLALIIGTILPR